MLPKYYNIFTYIFQLTRHDTQILQSHIHPTLNTVISPYGNNKITQIPAKINQKITNFLSKKYNFFPFFHFFPFQPTFVTVFHPISRRTRNREGRPRREAQHLSPFPTHI